MIVPRLLVLSTLAALGACSTAGRQAQPGAAVPSAAAPGFSAPSRPERIRTALAQNVRVVVADAGKAVRSASGVAIGTGYVAEGAITYVMTNAHVVAPQQGENPRFYVLLDLPTGDVQEFHAKLEAQGTVPENDLAVLSVLGISIAPARLAEDVDLLVGDDVFVVAAPYGRSLSVSGGLVSQIDYADGVKRVPAMIKTDAAIGFGASGGGIFSAKTGELLGIVEGYRTAKVTIPVEPESVSFDVPMPGETFAAPTAKIRRFLEAKGLGKVLGVAPIKTASAG